MTAKQLPDDTYLDKIYTMLAQIEQEEGAAMDAAARAAYASIDGGGLLHVFSTGHSHMIVEEMFYRSGGLVPVNPILSDELMLHTGAITSTHMERMPGKAAEVLGKAGLRAGDTILISSNTGINTVPVEAALYAKERGLTVVCVTSKKISRTLASRAPEGKRLYEVSDIVIDNHAPRGDGLLTIPGTQQITGGASNFGSLFIAQRVVLIRFHRKEAGKHLRLHRLETGERFLGRFLRKRYGVAHASVLQFLDARDDETHLARGKRFAHLALRRKDTDLLDQMRGIGRHQRDLVFGTHRTVDDAHQHHYAHVVVKP